MDTKSLCGLLLISFFFFGCPAKECRDLTNYEFELLINYAPVKDTFQVGDTIHISSSFEDEILDLNSHRNFKVEDFSFYSAIVFNKIEDGEYTTTTINDNQILNINVDYSIGSFSTGSAGILINKHNYSNSNYDFNFSLILQESGLFSVTNFSGLGDSHSTSSQRFEGMCSNDLVFAIYKLNNGDAYENNFALVEGKPPIENLTAVNYNRGGGFAFYVKD